MKVFHVLGVPHTIANKKYVACAFTQLMIRFCQMMKSRAGHLIIFYGHSDSQIDCDKLVKITNDEYIKKFYGEYNPDKLVPHGNPIAEKEFNDACITEIKQRVRPKDYILCFWGIGHKPIADAFPQCIIVEPGVGYPAESTFCNHKCFTSYAMLHYCYGRKGTELGNFYDCVIPNFFDCKEFEFKNKKKNYILYIGRIMKNKGLDIVIQLAIKTGVKLIIAGQGDVKLLGYDNLPSNIECVGSAGIEKRRLLMANAKCLMLPTLYIEPFGNVVIEAGLSGTPVITTDFGAFPETVIHGRTGYRCRTMEQFEWALKNIHKIHPEHCRTWALNFDMNRVKHIYFEYFDMLDKLYNDKGFYSENKDRYQLNWLNKDYN